MALTSEQAKKMGKSSSRKGSPNKSTSKVRDAFTLLLEDNLDQLTKDFKELEPKDRIKLFLDLSKYVIPQLKQTELKNNEENPVIPVINFTKRD